jgi:signal transduction histidine kinase
LAVLFYLRLIGLTFGTITYLFLLALILGHRRPRPFERLLFFLLFSLFLMFAGGLLEINSQIQYGSPPQSTQHFSNLLGILGLSFLLPLIWHAHAQYMRTVQQERVSRALWAGVALAYGTLLGAAVLVAIESHRFGVAFGRALLNFANSNRLDILAICAASAAVLEFGILRGERSETARNLAKWLISISCWLFLMLVARMLVSESASPFLSELMATSTIVAGILPGAALIYYTLKRNFLEFGAQRNLVYALSATFLALLYLALVRRVSGWLEPVLPPEATASILLFVLIFLFEPLERVIGPALHRRFHERVEHLQRLIVDLQERARQGNVEQLMAAAEQRIREEFGLAAVTISVPRDAAREPLRAPGGWGHAVEIPLVQDGEEVGLLEAASTGSYLTGETSAALEFLAEQLPAMLDLCRLIEEKLRLERELAERERLSLLGQMAASVSHNLRNPLSSMKTILQVQLEKPDLPFDLRHDCALVVGEIDRMSAKLAQLLKFAKPSLNGQRVGAVALAKQTAALFGRDAERRNVRLELDCPANEIAILGSEQALGEAVSNLIVNAIEAQPNGGRVRICFLQREARLEIRIEDDGPGITEEMRSKIFQPFFTTKVTGTGLGLSIVARRVAEMGGTISCESPVADGRGTRFVLTLPLGGANGSGMAEKTQSQI